MHEGWHCSFVSIRKIKGIIEKAILIQMHDQYMASYNQLTWNTRKKMYGAPLVPDMTTVQDELKNNLNDKYQNICFGLFYSSTHRQKMCHFQKNIFIFYQIMHKIIIMYYYDIFNFRGVCSDHVTAWCIMGRAFFSRTRAFSHEPGHFSHEPGHFLTNSGIIYY